ncbi:MAG: HAD-IA family hydrolase [Gemmatimonadetes bacterium]|nr:HAD-IA family hydrolase [Gemmatimonadota bacterium]
MCKPDPRIYRIFLERTGRDAREYVFVDHATLNVRAAADLGFLALHFTSPHQLRADLRAAGILLPQSSVEEETVTL